MRWPYGWPCRKWGRAHRPAYADWIVRKAGALPLTVAAALGAASRRTAAGRRPPIRWRCLRRAAPDCPGAGAWSPKLHGRVPAEWRAAPPAADRPRVGAWLHRRWA